MMAMVLVSLLDFKTVQRIIMNGMRFKFVFVSHLENTFQLIQFYKQELGFKTTCVGMF